MVFVTPSHLTDHRIKPSIVATVSVGQDADSAFTLAANEKEGADSLTSSSGASNKNTTTLRILLSLFLYTYFLVTSSPHRLNSPHHRLFHTGKRGLVTPHQ